MKERSNYRKDCSSPRGANLGAASRVVTTAASPLPANDYFDSQ